MRVSLREAAHKEEWGLAGEMERQSLPPVRSVLPVRQALGCQSGQIKPDTRPVMGLTGHRG